MKEYLPWVVMLVCGLVLATWMTGACRQPSTAVPTKVEINWPDAALLLDANMSDAGITDD